MSSPIVLFPDAEKLVVDHVRTRLAAHAALSYAAGAKVGTKVPNPRPPVLVTVRRAGGTARWPILDRPRMDFVVWHTTDYAAQQLAQLVRGEIRAMRGQVIGGTTVYSIGEFLGPTRTPDPETATPRYLFTEEITLRGGAA